MTEPKTPWYFKRSSVVIAVLLLGPLALPMIWLNPKYRLLTKIFWTVVVAALTWGMVIYTEYMLALLQDKFQELQAVSSA